MNLYFNKLLFSRDRLYAKSKKNNKKEVLNKNNK